ncbi:MAG: DUF3150 domain-containing protein [Gammaproteobacteria bacterium]|jgi:hypothetical protein|nr:DUF3150 domain-containing protein [Gammaproteobacteria bacterium]
MKGIVFLPEIHCISGTRSLPRKILAANDGRDLEKVLASAGTIQVIPREPLRPFHAARKAVESVLLAKGTRFFGGFFVDEALADAMNTRLDELKDGFEKAKVELINGLDGYIKAQIKDAPEWEDVIRASAPTKENLMEDISFSWICPPVDLTDPQVEEALKGSPLAIRIAKEMSQSCRAWLAEKRVGKVKGVPGIFVLKGIRVKAEALSFVDGRFRGLVTALDQVISQAESSIGTDGQGAASMVVSGVIRSAADPAEILAIGDRGECRVSVPAPLLDMMEDESPVDDESPVVSPDPVPVSAWAF